MNKYKKYFGWASLFLILSCSNLSNLCKHKFSSLSEFNYKEGGVDAGKDAFSYDANVEPVAYNTESIAAAKLDWDTLADVTFELRYNKDYQMDINYPVFGPSVQKLKGKELYITGYLIPLNPAVGLYAISRSNYSSCFFCGRAGPESVISLKFKTTPRQYKTDEYLTMNGRMELNDSNVRDFIYIFRDTEEFKAP